MVGHQVRQVCVPPRAKRNDLPRGTLDSDVAVGQFLLEHDMASKVFPTRAVEYLVDQVGGCPTDDWIDWAIEILDQKVLVGSWEIIGFSRLHHFSHVGCRPFEHVKAHRFVPRFGVG